MEYPKLIKKLERKDGQGNVYKVLPVGTPMNVDRIEEARLTREGYLAAVSVPTKSKKKPKKKIEPEVESNDLGELQTNKDE